MNKTLQALGETWERRKPINHVTSGGSERSMAYTFSRVYVGDVEYDDFSVPSGATWGKPDEHLLRYQYKERPPVLVTQNGPHTKQGVSRKTAEKQSYFIMSILNEYGYVGKWSRL